MLPGRQKALVFELQLSCAGGAHKQVRKDPGQTQHPHFEVARSKLDWTSLFESYNGHAYQSEDGVLRLALRQKSIDQLDQADAACDNDRINALEAHAWLDGPAEQRGRVGGAARELFLDMNGISLRAEKRGKEIEPPAAFQRLGEISVPVLVVWGDLDFPHLIENCRHLTATIKNAQAFVLAGTAHLPNLEQPMQFNRKLVEFCIAVGR